MNLNMSSMKPNPTISIVMPMYGVEKYIAKAITSVLNQTFHDWELLIVNDGSIDNSRSIAFTFAEQDERIKILDKENGGLSDARNYGLNNACGDYIHFFDSDDWIEPDYYSKLLSLIGDYDLVICGYVVDTDKYSNIRNCFSGELKDIAGNTLNLMVGYYLNFAWNKLFRKSFLIDNSLYYEKELYRIEDAEFMMRYLKCAPRIKFIEYPGYHYLVVNSASLSNIFDAKILDHAVRAIAIHNEIFRLICNNDEVIKSEIGAMTLSTIKSSLYKIARGIPSRKIMLHKDLICSIIKHKDISRYCVDYVPIRAFDRLILYLVRHRRWFLLYLLAQLKK